jgi:hypothetical protein
MTEGLDFYPSPNCTINIPSVPFYAVPFYAAVKPEIIDFAELVEIDLTGRDEDYIQTMFPEPYYKIENNKAIAVYGNYINGLFAIKRSGVLKARGDFQ